jgi:hypothetical protein
LTNKTSNSSNKSGNNNKSDGNNTNNGGSSRNKCCVMIFGSLVNFSGWSSKLDIRAMHRWGKKIIFEAQSVKNGVNEKSRINKKKLWSESWRNISFPLLISFLSFIPFFEKIKI